MKNIGLFGGTFDPIHNGHLHIARAFADEIGLDLVVFLPAGDPYHKDSTRTPAQERLNMVELAIADEPKFAASDCDIVRDGATYTFDTVQIFRQQFRPMVLKDIAERAHIDVSTVSRAINSKYVETDYGTYPLRHFFSTQFTSADGETVAARKVKAAIQEIIAAEDKRKPLPPARLRQCRYWKGRTRRLQQSRCRLQATRQASWRADERRRTRRGRQR